MLKLVRTLALATLPLTFSTLASAQTPVSSLLPETTIFALHLSPEGFDAGVVHGLFDELDTDAAKGVLMRLAAALEDAAESGDVTGGFNELDLLGELTEQCPELATAIEDAVEAFGPTVAGVSVSRFDPEPALVFATRPHDPSLSGSLLSATVSCGDARELASEADVDLWVVGDGGDFPLVLADVDGTLLLASDPDVLRGMVRRASGDGEPGLAGTRVGRLSGGMTSRGLGLTVNLSAAADALEAFRFLATEDDGTDVLFNRVLNTLRVVNGFAWHATVDAGGVLVESVSTFDARLAQEVGEEELLELLTCATCQLGDPTLLPQDAVALSGGMLPLGAFVDWVDSWLASVSDIGGVPEGWDLRTALAELLGIDADVAALGWLGDSWHAATLGVLDTDLRGWVQGLPTLITIPVSSEQAAREGLDQWPTLLRSLGDLTEDMGAGTEMDGFFRPQDAVSVRESAYRGIPYTRYRTGPAVDVGVAVFGGHLVFGLPAASLHAAVDVYLGDGPAAGRAGRTLGGLDLTAGDIKAYDVTLTSEFLTGLAEISDLAAGPIASALWFGVQGAAMAADVEVEPSDLPTYDELIGLADVVTDALQILGARTGPAIGTTELVDGARWSTWRLPLR